MAAASASALRARGGLLGGGEPVAQRGDARVQQRLAGHRLVGLARLRDAALLEQQLHVVAARHVVRRVDGDRLLQPCERGLGIAVGGERLGFVDLVLGLQRFLARHVLVEEGAHLALGQRADEAVHRLALVEQHAERDGADAEGLAELAGDLGLVVAVELGQLEAAGIGHLQLLQHGRQRAAGAAPGGPDVQQHGLLHGVVDEVGLEVLERDVDHGERVVEAGRPTIQGFPHSWSEAVTSAPVVGVVMGSSSDWETLQHAVEILAEFGIPYEAKVVSAHRMPDDMFAYAEAAAGRGLRAIIAGAGGAAHLPGMLAAKTTVPVLGVPVASRHLQGVDSLHTIVQMPRGVPVATFAIGSGGAANAALFAVAMLATKTRRCAHGWRPSARPADRRRPQP